MNDFITKLTWNDVQHFKAESRQCILSELMRIKGVPVKYLEVFAKEQRNSGVEHHRLRLWTGKYDADHWGLVYSPTTKKRRGYREYYRKSQAKKKAAKEAAHGAPVNMIQDKENQPPPSNGNIMVAHAIDETQRPLQFAGDWMLRALTVRHYFVKDDPCILTLKHIHRYFLFHQAPISGDGSHCAPMDADSLVIAVRKVSALHCVGKKARGRKQSNEFDARI